jgi:hypothetical protein
MKIRSNYVSNSSSSSFIVSYEPNAKEILVSKNGTKIVYSVEDLIDEIDNRIETHSESTYMLRKGSAAIYEYAEDWCSEDYIKELKDFLDKNPDYHKAEFQINYDDSHLKRKLLNLMKMGLVDVFASEYDLRDDC